MSPLELANWIEDYADKYTGGAGEDNEVVAFASDIAEVIRRQIAEQ